MAQQFVRICSGYLRIHVDTISEWIAILFLKLLYFEKQFHICIYKCLYVFLVDVGNLINVLEQLKFWFIYIFTCSLEEWLFFKDTGIWFWRNSFWILMMDGKLWCFWNGEIIGYYVFYLIHHEVTITQLDIHVICSVPLHAHEWHEGRRWSLLCYALWDKGSMTVPPLLWL